MKARIILLVAMAVGLALTSMAQDYEIGTLFNGRGVRSSGGYGAIGNKFTKINGEYAHMAELYGGWYVNHRFMLGIGAAATTNNIRVPEQNSAVPGVNMTYQYGQVGLMTEYVIASHKPVHLAFQLFSGGGFMLQYQRYGWREQNSWDNRNDYVYDENWFFVAEPGVRLEVNLLKWLRFSPGISYRAVYGTNSFNLKDDDINGYNINLSLKFGKF